MVEIPENVSNKPKNLKNSLLNSLQSKQVQKSQRGGDDSLMSLAAKRSSDSLKLTHYMLKAKLSDGLDQTIDSHFKQNPEMRGNTFIGLITTPEGLEVEVVDIDTAANAVVDATEDEARAAFQKNPVGYFNQGDFNMETPPEAKYKELKEKIERFFFKNADLFKYLKESPEAQVNANELYTPPR